MTTSIVFDDKERRMKDTSASGESYEYVALLARGWTRILELHPGPGSLACSLRRVRIEDVILGFEALSYVWGCDTLQNAVNLECNGR